MHQLMVLVHLYLQEQQEHKLSGAIKETEVLSFNYKQPATDLTDEQAATDEKNFYFIVIIINSPVLKVFEKCFRC